MFMAIIAGLLPIMWSHGTGADVMKRIAAPMIGGMVTSTILTLAVIPAIYALWRGWELRRITDGSWRVVNGACHSHGASGLLLVLQCTGRSTMLDWNL